MHNTEFLTPKPAILHLDFVQLTFLHWDSCICPIHDACSLLLPMVQKNLLHAPFCIIFGCEEEEVGTCLGKRKQEEGEECVVE